MSDSAQPNPPSSARPLRVMEGFSAASMAANPYLVQLVDALSAHCSVGIFSWRDAIAGRFDVLHVHFPDFLTRSSTTSQTLIKRALFLLLVLRLKLGRKAVVRTLHNVRPHDAGGRVDRYLLDLCDRLTTVWIRLTPVTPLPSGAKGPVLTIPHGDYRDWFSKYQVPATDPGRLLYFGLIRKYKSVDTLLRVFGEVDLPTASLRIVGAGADDEIVADIERHTAADSRISARTEFVSDAELAEEIGRAELVVLPYREMHNSGSLLLALSLNRPVLVPRNEVTAALSAEVGDGWVATFAGELTAAAITEALRVTAVRGAEPPRFSGRDWASAGVAHSDAYRRAEAIARRRPEAFAPVESADHLVGTRNDNN